MKPEYIRMQAFGPYLHETECDFTSLYAARLFLITGPTGGGKTTILDAMSFALYGKATGSLRDFRDMRSVAAPEEMDTEAEFAFTLGEARYKFLRRFHIHKKRTGGLEEQITAECHRFEADHWSLLTSGAEKVSKTAAELLGFTHSQFSQVIVLPQGEFRRLLLASSKEKLDILQVLFATSVWQQVASAANDRLKAVREELETLQAGKSALLEAAGAASPDELEALREEVRAQLEQTAADAAAAQTAFDLASEQLEAAKSLAEQFDRLEGHRKVYATLERQDDKIEQLRKRRDAARKVRELLPYLQQKNGAAETAKVKRQAAVAADKAMAAARMACDAVARKAEDIPALRQRQQLLRDKAAELSALLPDAARLEELQQQTVELEKEAAASEKKAAAQTDKVQTLISRIEKGEKYIKNIYETYIQPQPRLREELAKAELAARSLTQRDEGLRAADALRKKQLEVDGRLAAAQRILAERQSAVDRQERAFQENAARELALTLQDGRPCPVCGSPHHPAPHPGGGTAAGQNRLEEARQALGEAQAEADLCRTAAAETAARLQTAEEAAKQAAAACAACGANNLAAAEKQYAACKARLEEAESKGETYQKYLNGLEELKTDREKAQQEAGAAEQRKSELKSRLSALSASRGDILRRLPAGTDRQQLANELHKTKEQADSLQIRVQFLEREREETGLASSRAEEAAKAAAVGLREAEDRLLDAARELERAAMTAGLSPDTDFAGLLVESEVLAEMENRIRQHEDSLALTAGKIAELEEALAGKERPAAEDMTAEKQAAAAALSQTVEKQGALAARMQQLEEAAGRLEGLAEKQAGLDAQYGRVARVAAFINGKNPHRTPLHGFILGLMLDEVVEAASRYLARLSRGRYQLVRVDALGGSALRGLDIEVIDAHTGGQRRVCTLSGGELFLASLSLAFGLAEVVQSYAGGVTLDSIFIDEGFGTLDAETLEAAMKALADIQKEGRLVGLISHVSELRSRIPAHIEVVAGRDGSRLEIRPL